MAVSEIAKGHGKKSTSEKWGGKKAALLAAVIFTLGIGGTVGAAGPAAIENGTASKADGIASIAVGVGDQVNSKSTYQGATSIAVGTLNVIDADANSPYDGAASSVVGQVNYTKNANAAVIMGAGNKVTNSYREVKLDEKTLQELMQAYQNKDMQKVTEILQKAVPESGGQVMVMGGGNTVDYAQASQVMGVGNTLKGTKDSVSKYNLVDGFQNKVTNSQNTYVVGTKNNFVNMANSIVLGDNNNRIANNTDRIMKDTIVIGDGNTVQNGDESIAIGKNIHIKRDGGIGYEYDTGNVAIGSNAYISSYVNQGDSIAIGKNASVVNMNGSLEQAFAFGRTMGKDYSGSIAIGENAYARSGSTMIGVHDYQGKLGDMTIDFTKGKQEASSGIMDYSESIDATTIGNNSYNNGTFSTVLGSYSAVSGLYHNAQWGSKPYGVQNFGAAVVGSLNSVESLTSEDHNTAGMADSILGSANRTKNANGTVMVGAGNEVTNSINDFDASGIKVKGGIADPNTLSKAMRTAIQNQNGGGAAAVVGNGNIVDNATNVSILGSKNSLKNTKKAQLMGDNRVVDKADYSVIVGSADPELTTSNKNVTVLGYNANASVDGGVALGSDSIASTKAGVAGYDALKKTHAASDKDYAAWKATDAAVSIGGADREVTYKDSKGNDQKQTVKSTRQLTNLAAGTEDTDAVNVAQLKNAADAAKVHFYSVNSTDSTKGNYNNNGASGADALAAGVGAQAEADHSIAIGTNAHTQDSNGKKGSGDIAVGYGAHTNNYADQSGSIAIGQNAFAENMAGQQEAAFAFGQTTYDGDRLSQARIPADPSKVPGGMAIGQNTYVRTGGLMVGTHNYKGKLGDVEVDSAHTENNAKNVFETTLGTNSFNSGAFSTITGAYSIASGSYAGGRNTSDAGKNFGATIMGSLNSIESATASNRYSGVANSIVGTANRTFNSNGSLIFGAGNEITNSVTTISAPTDGGDSAQALQQTLMKKVQSSNGGGATLAIGGGNKADYAQQSQLLGVGNTLTGTSSSISKFNMLDGYRNTATNVSNTKIIGSNNTVNDKADSNTIIGDKHVVAAEKTNNVIIGNADQELTTSASNAVLIGHNANVSVDDGVALGSGSIASTDKGAIGYDLKGEDHSSDTTGTWKSTAAAVSVGDAAKKMTRQITNVAAGTEDTDAVNVAQLKRVSNDAKTKYYSVNETYNGKVPVIDGFEAYTNADNKGAKEFAGLAAGYMTYAGGIASTVTGSFSGIMNEAAAPGSNDFRGAAALSYGTFNINNNTGASQPFSGVANSIIGQANMTTDSNAALIYGAGNSVTNSYRAIDLQKAGAIMQNLKDPKALNSALKDAVPTSGGQVMVMGGGNTVTSAYMTQVVGVGNTVTGSGKEYAEGTSTQLNYVDGFFNTVEKGKNDYVIGSHNTLTGSSVDTNKSNLVLGDNHKLTDKKNNVILGSADDKDKVTDASDAVILGHNANASVDGGVAIGSGSIATIDKGAAGYKPYADADTSKDPTGTWAATDAAISFGKADGTMTRQITGVAAGTALTDAVNVAQLQNALSMPVHIYNGGKVSNGAYTSGTKFGNWNLSNLQLDFGDGLKAQEVGAEGDKRVLVTLDKNALKGDPDFKGDKGDTGPQGPAGKDGKDGINGKDGAVGPQGPAGKDGINGKDGKDGKDGINGKDGKDGKDGGVGTVVGDDTNITVENQEKDATKPANYKVSLNKEITVAKVTAGDTTVSTDGVSIDGGPSMTQDGINAADKKITHVAAGTETTDAVNYGQLKDVESKVDGNSQAITNINSHVNRLDNRINKVGAGAAALAGLHPLDFDPSDKWNFAVGYGNYRNANSVAVGAFYRPNGDTMVSVGTNFGNGENMVNAGVSFKLGQGSSYAGVSKAELAEENQKLKANDAAQDQKIQNQEKEIQELKKALEELKSHIK